MGLLTGEPARTARPRARPLGLALAILVAFGAAPGVSDPGATCWSPTGAPELFSWTGTPGIACRDSAEAGKTAPPAVGPSAGPIVGQTPQGTTRDAPRTSFSFSGSAYFGIAVAF